MPGVSGISSSNYSNIPAAGAGGREAKLEAVESALRKLGLPDEIVKKVMEALNGGQAKGAEAAGGAEGGGGAEGAGGAEEASAASSDAGGQKGIGELLEKILKALGLDDNTIKELLSSLNGGKAKGDNGQAAFAASYNADRFEG